MVPAPCRHGSQGENLLYRMIPVCFETVNTV